MFLASPRETALHISTNINTTLSALWLAKSGYKDVTVFDRQDYESNKYSHDSGADGASADINKIVRFSYGDEIEYQRLAFEASGLWEQWNRQLQEADDEELPSGLQRGERLWWNCGMLRLSATGEYGQHEMDTLKSMGEDGLREKQFECGNPDGESPVQRICMS